MLYIEMRWKTQELVSYVLVLFVQVVNCHESVIYILAPLKYATVYGCSDATIVIGAVGKVLMWLLVYISGVIPLKCVLVLWYNIWLYILIILSVYKQQWIS